jgi:hypothetical protein
MYARSLAVVAACTLFVLAFALVLNYEAGLVGRHGPAVVTTNFSCSPSDTSCEDFAITSASLHAVNYTDELGVVNYASVSFGLQASGPSTISSLNLFINGTSAGTVQGPFQPGQDRMVNVTLPSTISVTPGKTYLLSVDGTYGSGSSVWGSAKVTAR